MYNVAGVMCNPAEESIDNPFEARGTRWDKHSECVFVTNTWGNPVM